MAELTRAIEYAKLAAVAGKGYAARHCHNLEGDFSQIIMHLDSALRALEQTNAAGLGEVVTQPCTESLSSATAPAAPHSEPQGRRKGHKALRGRPLDDDGGVELTTFDPNPESPPTQDSPRPCTCHPEDNPPVPCPRKFAISECRAAAALGGVSNAELDALEAELKAERESRNADAIYADSQRHEIERLRAELATARNDALEEAALQCEKWQANKDRPYDGEWKTLGTTEISGSTFAYKIRALKREGGGT